MTAMMIAALIVFLFFAASWAAFFLRFVVFLEAISSPDLL
jgi:hypothetical protein